MKIRVRLIDRKKGSIPQKAGVLGMDYVLSGETEKNFGIYYAEAIGFCHGAEQCF